MATQLVLALPQADRLHPGGILAAPSNQAARHWLARPLDWPGRRLLLHGPPGSGKTELARGWLADGLRVDGGAIPALPALAAGARLLVDGADRAADEVALLHLLNAAAEAGATMLLTARAPPAHWPTRLADLASRLRAIHCVAIGPPEDALLAALLARTLADRQIAVPPAVQAWLLAHLPRTAAALIDAADRLDRAALARHHPITRPLAAAVLADVLADSADADETSMMPAPAATNDAPLL